MTVPETLAALQREGFRITSGRRAIIAHFAENDEPFSAQQVHAVLRKKGLGTNIASVYRELAFLAERGILTPVQLADGIQRFERAGQAHHHHLVCRSCSAIEDVALPHDLDGLEQTIAKEKGFTVQAHTLEFYGVCKKCG